MKFAFKMMNFVVEMKNFVFKMMNCVFKMGAGCVLTARVEEALSDVVRNAGRQLAPQIPAEHAPAKRVARA